MKANPRNRSYDHVRQACMRLTKRRRKHLLRVR